MNKEKERGLSDGSARSVGAVSGVCGKIAGCAKRVREMGEMGVSEAAFLFYFCFFITRCFLK